LPLGLPYTLSRAFATRARFVRVRSLTAFARVEGLRASDASTVSLARRFAGSVVRLP